MNKDARPTAEILSGLTLEQKAALGSGAAFWVTKTPGGLPRVRMEDGPHGVRHQAGPVDHMGIAPSEPATCFPPAVALAQTWDPDLIERVGDALGVEARSFGTDVLLGPGVNIKRDPRCGRNFEYFSEDPLLSGVMGAAWVRGLQRRGVGASVKHFVANNQEFERMRTSSDIDERPLREIYLRSFERVIREAHPWTVMASYNRLNGIPTTEHHWLLTEVLRTEWRFDGVVVSDWGAVGDRVRAVRAGLDLQMPGGDDSSDQEIVAALRAGLLDEAIIEASARRSVELAIRAGNARAVFGTSAFEVDSHHAFAREVAARAIVLLKNDRNVLPLARSGRIAVIGPFATEPRIQGGGSSRVVPTRVDIPLEEMTALAPDTEIVAVPGYKHDGSEEKKLRDEAVAAARRADTTLIFVGLTATDEVEGADRQHIDIPSAQLELVRAVAAANPRTVAVIIHGGVVRLHEIAQQVPGVLDATILGQAGGGAIADVLFGVVNPSGKLAETVPRRLSDVPSFLNYPGDQLRVRYGEGLFVGYRGYDRLNREVAFPFGHGLSYTSFEYRTLKVTAGADGLNIEISIENTGALDGREVVQVYVSKSSGVQRPPAELRGFKNLAIAAGKTATVRLRIPYEELAYWDIRLHRWVVEGGEYVVHAAASSRDFRLSRAVELDGDGSRVAFDEESTIGELMGDPCARTVIARMLQREQEHRGGDASKELGIDANRSAMRIPIGRVRSLSGGRGPSPSELAELLDSINRSDEPSGDRRAY